MSVPTASACFTFACPLCRAPLAHAGADEQRCPRDGRRYQRVDGIWNFLTPERAAYFEHFLEEYETVRFAEGRGSADAAFYLALPFEDRSGRFRSDWRIRARSFRTFLERVLLPLEAEGRPLRALDLGAGNGWLAHRLAERGHAVVALDLLTNAYDGLAAHLRHRAEVSYPGAGAVLPVRSEFDRLPLAAAQVDLAIFNGSLHYSTGYGDTLREALRVLRPDGRLVIMDSPVYRDPTSGAQMVREREAQFQRSFGFASNSIPSENFLTEERLAALAGELRLSWWVLAPFYGVRWSARPWKARLLGRREPARFLVLVGRRVASV